MRVPLLKVAIWGFGISAMGSLPLGTLNVAAMQVSLAEGALHGIYFSLGVTLVEMLYVRLSLIGIQWIRKRAGLLRAMDWIAVGVVTILAIGSFYAAAHPTAEKSFILQTQLPLFVLGLAMSAVNPVQIPFWFGWSSILFGRNILHARADYFNTYMVGIGFGSMASFSVFVFGGPLLVGAFNASQSVINYIIGGIFALTAVFQVVRIFYKKGLAESVETKGAELELAEKEDIDQTVISEQ